MCLNTTIVVHGKLIGRIQSFSKCYHKTFNTRNSQKVLVFQKQEKMRFSSHCCKHLTWSGVPRVTRHVISNHQDNVTEIVQVKNSDKHTVKIRKMLTTDKVDVIILKFDQCSFTILHCNASWRCQWNHRNGNQCRPRSDCYFRRICAEYMSHNMTKPAQLKKLGRGLKFRI